MFRNLRDQRQVGIDYDSVRQRYAVEITDPGAHPVRTQVVTDASTDAEGMARFPGLPTGQGTLVVAHPVVLPG